MITDAVSTWFVGVVASVVGTLPELPPEAQESLANFHVGLGDVMTYIGYFSPLIPFDQIAMAAGLLLVFWIAALVWQGARIVLSFVTLGGGSV